MTKNTQLLPSVVDLRCDRGFSPGVITQLLPQAKIFRNANMEHGRLNLGQLESKRAGLVTLWFYCSLIL